MMARLKVVKAERSSSPNLFGAHRYTTLRAVCAPLHGALSAREQPSGAPTVPRPVQRAHLPLRMLRHYNSRVTPGCYSVKAFRRNSLCCDGSPPHTEKQVMLWL